MGTLEFFGLYLAMACYIAENFVINMISISIQLYNTIPSTTAVVKQVGSVLTYSELNMHARSQCPLRSELNMDTIEQVHFLSESVWTGQCVDRTVCESVCGWDSECV